MMSLVIQSRARGSREATTRKTMPRETTSGPDSQTIFSTGGTLRRADRRSFHPPQNLASEAMGLLKLPNRQSQMQARSVSAGQRPNCA